MMSSHISRVSAVLQLGIGLPLLLGADVILPAVIPSTPPSAAWLGQILAAALLALAALNWLSRSALLGGIYSRPVVSANGAFYFVASTSLVRAATRGQLPSAVWIVLVPLIVLAGVYVWLLYRGPIAGDLKTYRGAP